MVTSYFFLFFEILLTDFESIVYIYYCTHLFSIISNY